jgi:hypothetical protein
MPNLKTKIVMRLLIEGLRRRDFLRVVFFRGETIFWGARHNRGCVFCYWLWNIVQRCVCENSALDKSIGLSAECVNINA